MYGRDEPRWDYDYHEDTSMKKCNKYYDYSDIDQLRQQALLNLSISNRLKPGKFVSKPRGNNKQKSKRVNHSQVMHNRSSQESESTLRPKPRNKQSMSLTSNSRLTNKPASKSSAREELKYYKRICAEMRKKNTELESLVSRKTHENKENLRALENRLSALDSQVESQMEKLTQEKYRELLQQMTDINERLNRKEGKHANYKLFYETVVESLKQFGLSTDSSGKSSTK